MATNDPEIGKRVVAAGIETNYLDAGEGEPLVLVHGSGPGVTGYANWRFTIPPLSRRFRVLAPDIAGFGYTERKPNAAYDLDFWIRHLVGFLDALGIKKAHFVGNSFGGGLTLALAARHPDRVNKFVLMGAAGTNFRLTPELDAVWGYEPSVENMRKMVQTFAYDASFMTDDLIRSRYEASIRPGFHESYSSLFPAPRERHIQRLRTPDEAIRAIPHQVLIVHGRDDRIVPLESSLMAHSMIARSELHVFGQCGHWTQIEKKDRFNRLIEEFFTN
jgi:2-hydroxymuconate-semialdehyde hydrolase